MKTALLLEVIGLEHDGKPRYYQIYKTMIKDKYLNIILIDLSYSMVNELENIRLKLSDFIEKIKIKKKSIYVSIIALYENESANEYYKILVEPTNVIDFKLPELITNEEYANSRKGFEIAQKISKKWKSKYFYSNLLNFNCKTNIILITDIGKTDLSDDNEQRLIKNLAVGSANLSYKLYCFKVGDAYFDDFKTHNTVVENKINFDKVLNDLSNNTKPYKRFSVWLFNRAKINPKGFILELTLFSIIGITFIDLGITIIQFISINIDINVLPKKEIIACEEKHEGIHVVININLNIDLLCQKNNLNVEYTLIDSLKNIKIGEYSLNSSEKMQDASKLLITLLTNIEKKYEINGDVEVHIAGETDNTPVKGILYSGEYGDLQNMPLAMYTEIQFPIFLQTNKYSELPNEKITLTTNSIFKDNKTLSFLRGYAFWDLIRRKSDIVIKQPTSYYQYGKINSLQGGNYRKVTVLIFAKNIKPK